MPPAGPIRATIDNGRSVSAGVRPTVGPSTVSAVFGVHLSPLSTDIRFDLVAASRHSSPSALIYARVSQDRRHGRSVAEQEAECRAWAGREGWRVVDVIVDNDRSASQYRATDS